MLFALSKWRKTRGPKRCKFAFLIASSIFFRRSLEILFKKGKSAMCGVVTKSGHSLLYRQSIRIETDTILL